MTDQNQMMDRLLADLARQAEQAEIYAVESESTQITFEAGELKSSLVEETSGVALRALVDGRVGFTASSGRSDPATLVERTVASARFGEPLDLTLPGPLPAAEISTFDPALAEVPLERLVAIGREIIATLRAADPDGKIDVDIERTSGRSWLHNSAGARVEQTASGLHISMSMERVRGDDVLMVGDTVADIRAGAAAGLPTYGVMWGSGTRAALEAAGADLVRPDLNGIWELLGRGAA